MRDQDLGEVPRKQVGDGRQQHAVALEHQRPVAGVHERRQMRLREPAPEGSRDSAAVRRCGL
jgi:hypothetical protein